MGHSTGRVSEIRIGSAGLVELWIACPSFCVPAAGQYLVAYDLDDAKAALGTPLFLVEQTGAGFWSAPAAPCGWQPGTKLDLVGPLGHGFDLPKSFQRLALVAAGDKIARLMPLVTHASKSNISMTLFTDLHPHGLPSVLEVNPLYALKSSLDWPDFIAMDIPHDSLDEIHNIVGLPVGSRLPCPSQALITIPMPCVGRAQCGACAVKGRRGWKLACQDGPVIDLNWLAW
jgi:hypothetical protein